MDLTKLYSMYSDAMDNGKLEVLRMFLEAVIDHPILAIFYGWLIFGNWPKAVTEFAKRFI